MKGKERRAISNLHSILNLYIRLRKFYTDLQGLAYEFTLLLHVDSTGVACSSECFSNRQGSEYNFYV